MPYRKCRNPLRTDGLTMDQVIEMAIDAFGWPRKKVLSWYELENPALRKSRPSELVDRGDTDKIIEFLERRKRERINNQKKTKDQ
jgi:hypothetical protein